MSRDASYIDASVSFLRDSVFARDCYGAISIPMLFAERLVKGEERMINVFHHCLQFPSAPRGSGVLCNDNGCLKRSLKFMRVTRATFNDPLTSKSVVDDRTMIYQRQFRKHTIALIDSPLALSTNLTTKLKCCILVSKSKEILFSDDPHNIYLSN